MWAEYGAFRSAWTAGELIALIYKYIKFYYMAGGRTEFKVISAGVVDVNIVLHNVKKSLHF